MPDVLPVSPDVIPEDHPDAALLQPAPALKAPDVIAEDSPDAALLQPASASSAPPSVIEEGSPAADSLETHAQFLSKLTPDQIATQYRNDRAAGRTADPKNYEDAYTEKVKNGGVLKTLVVGNKLAEGAAKGFATGGFAGAAAGALKADTPDGKTALGHLLDMGTAIIAGGIAHYNAISGAVTGKDVARSSSPLNPYDMTPAESAQNRAELVAGQESAFLNGVGMLRQGAVNIWNAFARTTNNADDKAAFKSQFHTEVDLQDAKERVAKGGSVFEKPGAFGVLSDPHYVDRGTVEQISQSPLADPSAFLPGMVAAKGAEVASVAAKAQTIVEAAETADRASLAARSAAKAAEVVSATLKKGGSVFDNTPKVLKAGVAAMATHAAGGDAAFSTLMGFLAGSEKSIAALDSATGALDTAATKLRVPSPAGPVGKFASSAFQSLTNEGKSAATSLAFNLPFALGAQSQDQAIDTLEVGLLAHGFVRGGAHGVKAINSLSPITQMWHEAPRPTGERAPVKDYGADPLLDGMHRDVVKIANNSGNNLIQAARNLLSRSGSKGELYLGRPEQVVRNLQDMSARGIKFLDPDMGQEVPMTPETAKDWADQAGVSFTVEMPPETPAAGQPVPPPVRRNIAIVPFSEGAPALSLGHELWHVMENTVVSPEERTHFENEVSRIYGGPGSLRFENARRHYAGLLSVDPSKISDSRVASELMAETVSGRLNAIPVGAFGPGGEMTFKNSAYRRFVRDTASFTEKILRKLGADVPDTTVHAILPDSEGRPYITMQPGGKGPRSGLGWGLSSELGALVDNFLESKRLDTSVAEADGHADPFTEVEGAPTKENPIQHVREVAPEPAFKKGDPIESIKNADGEEVAKNGIVTKVVPDEKGDHQYEIEYTDPEDGKRKAGIVPEKFLQSPVKEGAGKVGEATPAQRGIESVVKPKKPVANQPKENARQVTDTERARILGTPAEPQLATAEVVAHNNKVIADEVRKPAQEQRLLQTDYYSASEGRASDTGPVREARRDLVENADPKTTKGLRTLYEKLVHIYKHNPTPGNGRPFVTAFSFDNFIRNLELVDGWLRKNGLGNDPALARMKSPDFGRAVQDYWRNQANGYRGDGQSLVRPADLKAESVPAENPDYTPVPVSKHDVEIINLAMGIELPKTSSVATRYAANMAKMNGHAPTLNEAGVEITNPFTADLIAKGFDPNILHSTVQQLSVDKLVSKLTPSEYKGTSRAVLATVRAGFMPQPGEEKIGQSAIRDREGSIYTGRSHNDILADLQLDGGLDEMPRGYVDGFVTSTGRFVTREQAYRIANKSGQLDEEARNDMGHPDSDKKGSLEALDFDAATRRIKNAVDGKFMPRPEGALAEPAEKKLLLPTRGKLSESPKPAEDNTSYAVKPLAPKKYETGFRRGVANIEDHGVFMPREHGNEETRKVAAGYMHSIGNEQEQHDRLAPIDTEFAKRIADFYEEAADAPHSPEVKAAYSALADETLAQYAYMKRAGITIEPFDGKTEPYKDSAAMRADVRDNKHLYFFKTEEGFAGAADNPLLQPSGVEIGGHELLVNDVFRAVHDYFGHTAEGYEFGPRGELNAYLAHSRMFSDEAKPALAAETLAQNSWVNFGKHLRREDGTLPQQGDPDFIPLGKRPFAEQKNLVVPQEFIDEAAHFIPKTPEFKKWFGDSKVVDDKGNPKIVYHGGTRFDEFHANPAEFRVKERPDGFGVQQNVGEDTWTWSGQPHKTRAEAEADLKGRVTVRPVYATDDIDVASGYAGQYSTNESEIKPLYLRMENPLDLRDPAAFKKWVGEPGGTFSSHERNQAHASFELRSGGKVLQKAHDAGYDGVIFHDTDVMDRGLHTSYAFFNADQATAAPDTSSNGTWWDHKVRQQSDATYMPKTAAQHDGEPLEHAVGDDLNLIHFGGTGQRSVDPKEFGKSGLTSRSELAGAPRSYFYEQGKYNTHDPVAQRGDVYGAKVSGSRIYDGDADPLDYGSMVNREKADTMLQDEGYVGIARTAGTGKKAYRQVELFKPTRVSPIEEPNATFMPRASVAQEKALKDSKVRGPDGKLLPVFHGTYSDFKHFGKGDLGYHFGTQEAAAARIGHALNLGAEYDGTAAENAFAAFPEVRENLPPGTRGAFEGIADGARTVPVFLDLKNPLRMIDVGPWDQPEQVWSALPLEIQLNSKMRAADKATDSFAEASANSNTVRAGLVGRLRTKAETAIREGLKSLGYDGVVYENAFEAPSQHETMERPDGTREGHDSYIAFDNKQIVPAYAADAKARFMPREKIAVPGADELVDARDTRAYKDIARSLTDDEAESIRSDTARSMVDLYKDLPPDSEFEAAAHAGMVKKGWYQRASDTLSTVFGEDKDRFVGLLAATSPRQSVKENLQMALNIWADWEEAGRPLGAEELTPLIKKHAELHARVPNSVKALQGYEPELSGNKVEAFRKNLLGDMSHSTNDTWMALFANVDQKAFRAVSGHLAFTSKVRKVADKLDLHPAEVQETIWSFFKTLVEGTTVKRNAKETLRSLSDSDILNTPEFHDEIVSDPKVRAQLERLGFTGFDQLGNKTNSRGAGRPGSLAEVALQEGGEGRLRVLDRIANRAQRLKDAEPVPAQDGENPY